MAKFSWGRAAGAGLSSIGGSLQDAAIRQQQQDEMARRQQVIWDHQAQMQQENREWQAEQRAQQNTVIDQRFENQRNVLDKWVSQPPSIDDATWQSGATQRQGPGMDEGDTMARQSTSDYLRRSMTKPTKTEQPFQFTNPYGFPIKGEPTPEMFKQWHDEGFDWDGSRFIRVKTDVESGGIGGVTPNQQAKQDAAYIESNQEAYFGTHKIGVGGINVVGSGLLGSRDQAYSGSYNPAVGQLVEEVQIGVAPIFAELLSQKDSNGIRVYEPEAAAKLALEILGQNTPGAFPPTDFNLIDGIGWDRYEAENGGKLIDESFWADDVDSTKENGEAYKKIKELYDKSSNKTLTYYSIISGLEEIGMPRDKAKAFLDGLHDVDIDAELAKAERIDEGPPQSAYAEFEAVNGSPPEDVIFEDGKYWFVLNGFKHPYEGE